VIEFLDRILPMVDEEITAQVADLLKGRVEIHTDARGEITKTESLEKDGVSAAIPYRAYYRRRRVPDTGGIDAKH
jgi:pyruvate/2-oxoglutarate dehydrogenase complex dihydrolipoamide dehydrogenase (E3) component